MKSKIFGILTGLVCLVLCLSTLFFTPPEMQGQTKDNTEQVQQVYSQVAPVDDTTVQDAPTPADDGPVDEDTGTDEPKDAFFALLMAWIKTHTAEFVLAFLAILKIIVNLTPTEQDNKWYDIVERILNSIFPNLKKGGGTHTAR